MPNRAPTRCHCGALATKAGRCDNHQRKAWANTSHRNHVIDKTRWKKTADLHLLHHPRCRNCGATEHLEVDHIIEVTDGGAMYDPANLQTLCHECHKAKTLLARRSRPTHTPPPATWS